VRPTDAEVGDVLAKASAQRAEREAPGRVDRLKGGAQFVLDDPADLAPVWGGGDEVLWACGEPILVAGPPGVGKTTLVGQLLRARLGLDAMVLGYPVATDDRSVLYLAMDRPRQIRRSMRRIFSEQDRSALDRLVVWEGPLPLDVGRVPEVLVELATEVGAGTVIVDSLKDAAVKLTDDEVGGNVNRALQFLVTAGIEVCALHHQRKSQGGAKPTSLEDVYGSTWLAAGAGSVVLLWGAAGDPIVELSHLKQPAGEVGPFKVEHDHDAGRTVRVDEVDPMAMLRAAPNGITSMDLARAIFSTDAPTDNRRKKAQRKLDRLVREGLARKREADRAGAGGVVAARYYAVSPYPESLR